MPHKHSHLTTIITTTSSKQTTYHHHYPPNLPGHKKKRSYTQSTCSRTNTVSKERVDTWFANDGSNQRNRTPTPFVHTTHTILCLSSTPPSATYNGTIYILRNFINKEHRDMKPPWPKQNHMYVLKWLFNKQTNNKLRHFILKRTCNNILTNYPNAKIQIHTIHGSPPQKESCWPLTRTNPKCALTMRRTRGHTSYQHAPTNTSNC